MTTVFSFGDNAFHLSVLTVPFVNYIIFININYNISLIVTWFSFIHSDLQSA